MDRRWKGAVDTMDIPVELSPFVHRARHGVIYVADVANDALTPKLRSFVDGLKEARVNDRIEYRAPEIIARMQQAQHGKAANDATIAADAADESLPIDEAVRILEATRGRRVSDIHLVTKPTGEGFVGFEIDGNIQLHARLTDINCDRLIRAFWLMGTGEGGNYSNNTLNQSPFARYTYSGELLPSHLFMSRAQHIKTLGRVMVIRLVERTKDGGVDRLEMLGYDEETLADLHAVSRLGTGGIVIAGEIGHGKTTLLYALALADYEYRQKLGIEPAVYSREQPPERVVPWIRQIPINDDSEWEPAHHAMLRGALKLGITGEMRDITEIRSFTVPALIFKAIATFHGQDTISTLVRFKEQGVADHLLRNPQIFRVIISQRLVSILCPACSTDWVEAEDADDHFMTPKLRRFGLLHHARRRGRGGTPACGPACVEGHIGRQPIIEIFENDEEIVNLVLESPVQGRRKWLCTGVKSMGMKAFEMVRDGIVDPEYIHRLMPIESVMQDFELSGRALFPNTAEIVALGHPMPVQAQAVGGGE
jgi:type II secretory ATPase GspE/PulE/Tfp pilus assembly ATPase PilB-like protein